MSSVILNQAKQKKPQLPKNKTIGFIFFNSGVMLTIGEEKQQKILICDRHDEYTPSIPGFHKQFVDFDSFQALYKTGEKYGDKYNTKISGFEFDSLDIKSVSSNSQGQTALGPAIVTALGVVSKHGQGSSLVVVTDGIANKGIFDQTEQWEQSLKFLKIRLQKLKCFMTVLEFRKLYDKNKMKQEQTISPLDNFCKKYTDQVVRKINVILDKEKQSSNKGSNNSQNGGSTLGDIEEKMKTGLDRDNCYFSNEVFIRCQNPNISYQQFQERLRGKLFDLRQAVHLVPKVDLHKLNQKDYLHHFMTQVVIKYQNTKTGQQSIFFSYIAQKFVKHSKMKQKDKKALDNQDTFLSVIEYLHAEEQQLNLDNLPLGIIRETFRRTLCMTPIAQKTLRFPSKHLMNDQNSYEWMQNMRKFQDSTSYQQIQKNPLLSSNRPAGKSNPLSLSSQKSSTSKFGQASILQKSQSKQKSISKYFQKSQQKSFPKQQQKAIQQEDEDDDYMYL